MKRSRWIACLVVGAIFGAGGVAWSRSGGEASRSEAKFGAEEEPCASESGEACNCSTGLNRASLMKSGSKAAAEKK